MGRSETKGANGGRMSSARLSVIEKRLAIFKMRLEGLPFAKIAEQMGMSVSGVWKCAATATEQAREAVREATENLLTLEVERLNTLQSCHWRAATVDRNPQSTQTVLKCIAERSKLLGLYSPDRVELKATQDNAASFHVDPQTGLTPAQATLSRISIDARQQLLEALQRCNEELKPKA